jgi:NADPH2:quinone reductase
MKAIRVHEFGGPKVLKYDSDVPIPQIDKDEVLIRVKAVGINPVETYIRSGQYARLPSLPFTPGGDCSGIVEAIGSSVSTLAKGQRVYVTKSISGAYAQFTSAHFKNVHLLPDELSYPQGAALGVPYLTAYRALVNKANMCPGELVLVHGASGGVGTAAVQIARAHGGVVIGTAGSEEGMSIVQKAGAHHVFNHRDTSYIEKIADIGKSKGGIDVVLENNAHLNLAKDMKMMARDGRIAIVGNRGMIEINPRDAMSCESKLLGVMLFNATQDELDVAHGAIHDGIRDGWLRPLVGKEFLIQNASDAHEDIINSKGALGKTVLLVD